MSSKSTSGNFYTRVLQIGLLVAASTFAALAQSGAVYTAVSAGGQPLMYNWDNGTTGCGVRVIVLTDVPSQFHSADVSINLFRQRDNVWGALKGGFSKLPPNLSDIKGQPVAIEAIEFYWVSGDRVIHKKFRPAPQTPGQVMADSEPDTTLKFLLAIANGDPVMFGVRISGESNDRLFRAAVAFERNENTLVAQCLGRLLQK